MFWFRFQRPSATSDCDVMSVIYDCDPCGLEVRPPEDGLEIWSPEVGGLQVSTRVQVEQALEVFRGCDDLEAVNPNSSGIARVNTESLIDKIEQEPNKQLREKLRLILVLMGVALLFVMVAAVLGIVLGLRLNNNNKTPSEPSTTPPASSSNPSMPSMQARALASQAGGQVYQASPSV